VAKLISFDIDGTLETGDPPGYITMARVREALALGYIIGSCSDRPVSHQRELWQELRIPVDFTVLKHRLADVKARFPGARCYHIGDTEVDERFALAAGFEFLSAHPAAHHAWRTQLFGG
jgi:hypothetical protein